LIDGGGTAEDDAGQQWEGRMPDAAFAPQVYSQSAWENEVWAFVFATVEARITYGGRPPDRKLDRLLARGKTWARGKLGLGLVPNPFFVLNGICAADDDSSDATARYLQGRLGKSLASIGQSLITGSLKAFTVVDPATMVVAGASIGSTIAHTVALAAIARRWRSSTTISAWIDCLLVLKLAKLGHKTLSMVSASIPYMPPGTSTALQALAELPTVAGYAESLGAAAAGGAVVKRVAIELHWRAYREHAMARSGGAVGPASAILVELFTKRTETRLLGKHDIDAIIREPAGWMAISDKIALL
jgi:hypothetical protein